MNPAPKPGSIRLTQSPKSGPHLPVRSAADDRGQCRRNLLRHNHDDGLHTPSIHPTYSTQPPTERPPVVLDEPLHPPPHRPRCTQARHAVLREKRILIESHATLHAPLALHHPCTPSCFRLFNHRQYTTTLHVMSSGAVKFFIARATICRPSKLAPALFVPSVPFSPPHTPPLYPLTPLKSPYPRF
jgi:hypothetical protein